VPPKSGQSVWNFLMGAEGFTPLFSGYSLIFGFPGHNGLTYRNF